MIRWLVKEFNTIVEIWRFVSECERKREEWYRGEIIDALDKREFERAAILEREFRRPVSTWGSL